MGGQPAAAPDARCMTGRVLCIDKTSRNALLKRSARVQAERTGVPVTTAGRITLHESHQQLAGGPRASPGLSPSLRRIRDPSTFPETQRHPLWATTSDRQ
jgi:hypothetical protein